MALGWAQRILRGNKARASLGVDAVPARLRRTHGRLMMRDVCGILLENKRRYISHWRKREPRQTQSITAFTL